MNSTAMSNLAAVIVDKALEVGADLAGIANIEELKNAPSFTLTPKLPEGESVANRPNELGLKPGEVAWPEDGKSVLVIAKKHPRDNQRLDWWENRKNTPGNIMLIEINERVSEWIGKNYKSINTYPLPYHVEKGGIYLKDAAVLAGIGIIAKNNLLITTQYGPSASSI